MARLEAGMRTRIAKFLPHALETALLSYHEFAEEQATAPDSEEEKTDDKAKTFKAHHDACKVALAHIQLLIDLARWADLPDPEIEDENADRTLRMLLENAEAEVDANRNRG
ncbi:MAG: hypothetical protein KA099_03080 [Alphaproteobacteria bacterium]|nr:hypothetical protein [Alphaproteobacteria bacterium]MBP7759326.1 hypothetical protein [Alphaproteobacteria bacterium]MBP7762539.1 hypothetical protein [Alphaproteobacteria bacterium]MBP7904286.1 hypothetical protein [Alphaproteobacteria bacterium]